MFAVACVAMAAVASEATGWRNAAAEWAPCAGCDGSTSFQSVLAPGQEPAPTYASRAQTRSSRGIPEATQKYTQQHFQPQYQPGLGSLMWLMTRRTPERMRRGPNWASWAGETESGTRWVRWAHGWGSLWDASGAKRDV